MLLTKAFSAADFARGLASWDWLGLDGKTPVLASLFGDVFLAAEDGYWFLDQVEGSLTHSWTSRDELQADLSSEEGQDRYLLGGLAMAAERAGLLTGPAQVYDFVQPPILGGAFSVENLTVMDFVVSSHIAGQLLRQVKALPPGAAVTGITIDGEAP